MTIPSGWKLVPVEPTMAMEVAYRGALKEYIDRMPLTARDARNLGKKGGYRVKDERIKIKVRWRAMLAAAPVAPAENSSTNKEKA